MMAAALIAVVAAVVPATAASAAPPIDPRFPGSWAKWTFHAGGNYNLVMDVARSGGHGAAVQLYGDHGGSNQIWFQEAASGGGQFLHPGYDRWLCLGRTGTGWGTRVVVQACDGSINQVWAMPRYAQQFYFLKPYNDTNVCVDVPSSNFVQGADLQLWGCNQSSAQYWPTGQCYAGGCDMRWPDVTDCDTSGADEVRDVSQLGDRIVLVRATGCHAFYARGSHDQHNNQGSKLVLLRHHTDRNSEAIALGLAPGQTAWTPMYGVGAGDTFQVCMEYPGSPSLNFCTQRSGV